MTKFNEWFDTIKKSFGVPPEVVREVEENAPPPLLIDNVVIHYEQVDDKHVEIEEVPVLKRIQHEDKLILVISKPKAVGKQTSPEVSSLAAKYTRFNVTQLNKILTSGTDEAKAQLAKDIRTLAGSALVQDETKGNERNKK